MGLCTILGKVHGIHIFVYLLFYIHTAWPMYLCSIRYVSLFSQMQAFFLIHGIIITIIIIIIIIIISSPEHEVLMVSYCGQ